MALRFLPGFAPPVVSAAAHPATSPKAAISRVPGLKSLDKCDPLGLPIGSSVHVLALQLTGLSKYFIRQTNDY